MFNQEEFTAGLKERLDQSRERYQKAEADLDTAERSYDYWRKLVAALQVVIAHEEWLEQHVESRSVAENAKQTNYVSNVTYKGPSCTLCGATMQPSPQPKEYVCPSCGSTSGCTETSPGRGYTK